MASKRPASELGSPGTPSKKRKVLTLAQKVRVISDVEAGLSQRAVAVKYGCGRTQVHNILADKSNIQLRYREGTNAEVKYLVPRNLKYGELDKKVFDFFCEARNKKIPVTGALLQRQAHIIGLELGCDSFSASNGWLESFASRHQLKMANLHGESAEISEEACTQWQESLPQLLHDYALEDIYNCDETGIFFRSIPTKSLIRKAEGEKAQGTKVLKDRFTLLLTASATGVKEKMWIIGKSKKPHSFPKNASVYHRSFTYRYNTKAWMTTEIFKEYLNSLNNKFQMQNRKILLFLDNCPAHPPINLSNVKLAFLPKNTTAVLQPMDAGIIACLKSRYKRLMMGDILQVMKEASDVTALAKKVTIWDAVVHTQCAWDVMTTDTIVKCFTKCGIHKNLPQQPITPTPETGPDDYDVYFSELLEVPWDEYLAYDDELEAEQPCRAPAIETLNEESSTDDPEGIEPESCTEAITVEEALKAIKNLTHYCMDNPRAFALANQLGSVIKSDAIKAQLTKSSKQTSIKSFFHKP